MLFSSLIKVPLINKLFLKFIMSVINDSYGFETAFNTVRSFKELNKDDLIDFYNGMVKPIITICDTAKEVCSADVSGLLSIPSYITNLDWSNVLNSKSYSDVNTIMTMLSFVNDLIMLNLYPNVLLAVGARLVEKQPASSRYNRIYYVRSELFTMVYERFETSINILKSYNQKFSLMSGVVDKRFKYIELIWTRRGKNELESFFDEALTILITNILKVRSLHEAPKSSKRGSRRAPRKIIRNTIRTVKFA